MTQTQERISDHLDTSKLRFVDVDGIRTRYYEDGKGEPLVLFHGGHFASLYSLDAWSLALPGLAKRFRVIAVDKLGQGFTDNPGRPEDYTFDALLKHAIGFMDAIGVSGAHLAGHSRGALLIAAMAFERPDLVKTLLPVSTNTLAPDDPAYPGGAFYAEVERLTPPGPPTPAAVRMEPDAQAFSREQVTDDFVRRLLEIAQLPKTQEAKQIMVTAGPEHWAPSMARHKERILSRIDMEGMPAPTLLTWGMDDKSAFVPLAFTLFDRIAARTPRAALHIVNSSGHYVFREQTSDYIGAISAFALA